ncbi:hypothetical protein DRN73_01965 [Candidatus Pacearchaeota archaeon]|nr:MAG: hypothetical protein DRN73_01965 [Candidatus Pacearchaeota archaeon]
MNIEYLGNHSERIKDLSQIQEREIYVVGRGKDAFIGFRTPEEMEKPQGGTLILYHIDLYEARLRDNGEEIASEKVKRDSELPLDNFLDVEVMGLFKPRQESRLRKIIEEKLGINQKRGDLVAETS